jgi:threonine/homoserine/homoserine lactone efflux protein
VNSRLSDVLTVVLAFLVPLAGLMLVIYEASRGNRDSALRIGAATALGIVLYAIVFTG